MADHYLLYGHGGAYNHGSEASVRCDISLLRKHFPGCRITLASHFPDQDRQFGLDADEIVGRDMSGNTNEEIYAAAIDRITPKTVCLSVGGDMYCYPNWQRYAAIHYAALARGAKSILWSCSVEPSMLGSELLSVLRSHHLITARESVTAQALREYGLSNVQQVSDIAFSLPAQPTSCGVTTDYIVLNLSPLVLRRNPRILGAFQALVQMVLDGTPWNVVLLPHVLAVVDNDRDALALLKQKSERIWMAPPELSAAELKSIIAKARYCVAARTHVCVAAYASCVPTLAIGYSTKALGIAKDLGQECFLLNADALDKHVLLNAFKQLIAHENEIRAGLLRYIPAYCQKVVSKEVLDILK